MVTSVTSFGRSGLSDWLLQRITATIMTAYLIFIVAYFGFNDVDYSSWKALNAGLPMKMFSLLTVLSIAIHSWIGMWGVLTDYVTVRLMGAKATALRMVFQLGVIAVSLLYVVWAIDVLWGI